MPPKSEVGVLKSLCCWGYFIAAHYKLGWLQSFTPVKLTIIMRLGVSRAHKIWRTWNVLISRISFFIITLNMEEKENSRLHLQKWKLKGHKRKRNRDIQGQLMHITNTIEAFRSLVDHFIILKFFSDLPYFSLLTPGRIQVAVHNLAFSHYCAFYFKGQKSQLAV